GSSCSAVIANAVVADVAAAVRSAYATTPTLQNVVIVGDHSVIPHAAIPETVEVGKEYTYASDVGGDNATVAALTAGNFFSDAPYGDLDPVLYAGRPVYIEDLGVSRLVETPAQIEAQLARFLDPNGDGNQDDAGILDPETALVGGYDFLIDNANAITAGLEETATVTPLISETWTADELSSGLTAQPDLVSINAHADHSRVLTAQGDLLYRTGETPDPDQSLDSAVPGEVPTPKPGAFHFTVGCHAGLSVPDWGPPGSSQAAVRPGDWPEFLGENQVVYLANTGYGYGDDDAVAYSEALFTFVAEQVGAGGVTIGEAVIRAKSEFASRLNNAISYDFKVVQQPVLYGLPMWEIPASTPAAFTSGAASAALDPTPASGDLPASASIPTVSYDWSGVTAPTVADFLSVVGEVETKDGLPIVPRDTVDVTATDPETLVARGAIVERLSATEVSGAAVQYGAVDIGDSAPDPALIAENVFYPTAFQAMTSVAGSAPLEIAPEDRLVLYPGQFAQRGNSQTFTLIDEIDATVYYADTTSTDSIPDVTAPGIVESSAQVIPGAVLFRVIADADDVVRGVIQYLDDGTWRKVELERSGLVDREWIGQLPNPSSTSGGRYDIQLLDSGANVGTGRFKGDGYLADDSGLPPSATVVVQTEAEPPLTLLEDDWSSEPVVARLVGQTDVVEGWSVESVVEETSDGPVDTSFGTDADPRSGFTIDEDGIFMITYVKGLQTIERTVKIDSTAPVVEYTPPVEVLFPGENVDDEAVVVACADLVGDGPGIASGLDGECVTTADGDNRGQLSTSAIDVAGNIADVVQTLALVEGDAVFTDSGWFTEVGAGVEVNVDGDLADRIEVVVTDEDGNVVALPLTEDGRYQVDILLDGSSVFSTEVEIIDVDVDSTPPEILGVDGLQPVYDLGDTPGPVTCTAFDATSGIESCEITQPDTSEEGDFAVTATATDVAGNQTTRTFAYSVAAPCDPTGDAVNAAGDIVGCSAIANGDGTVSISLRMGAAVDTGGDIQYRLDLAAAANASGSQVKWSGGTTTGKALKRVDVAGNVITFQIDLRRLKLSGSILYWSAAIQDGTPGQQGAGFLDFAPDVGYFELAI
ncbi:MAG: hypothetical protein WCA57_03905, partial [Ilumatobacteraceae bacterium]